MSVNRNKNLFGQSRWQIILSLRKRPQGVKELSKELGVTDNAIRPHLSFLERDGLVEQKGIKQSGGKPAHIYELTEEAEQLFPKAYGVLLANMLSELRENLSDTEFTSIIIATADRLSKRWRPANGDILNRMETGIDVLNELGGLAEIFREDGKDYMKGYSCPLSDATKDHHEVCHLAEVLLKDLTGLELERCCTYDPKPKCCFQVLGLQ